MRAAPIRLLLATVAATLFLAAPAQAIEEIETFTSTVSDTQAGGHPDIETSFQLENPGNLEAARTVVFNMAEGFFGNPSAITRCTSLDFALDSCPSAAQAGLITVRAKVGPDANKLLGTAPLYNLEPQNDEQTARLAFVLPTLGIPISIPVAVRTGSDFGLRFTVSGISQVTPLAGADLVIWGYPADSSHDEERFPKGSPGKPPACIEMADTACLANQKTPAAITVRPLIDNPSLCAGDLTTSLEVETYQDSGRFSRKETTVPATTGCRLPGFKPVMQLQPTTTETDAPSGLDIELQAKQLLDAAISPSQIRSAFITLPEGLTINPDAADGQTACSDADARFGSEAPSNCPDSAKIGTFEIGTPALEGPLEGSVYIGAPLPGDQYRLFLLADGFGVHAKLVGSVHPDPTTGQLTTTLVDLPQVPFDEFNLHLFASDRGLMATPIRCTIHTASVRFVAWNALLPEQRTQLNFGLDRGPNGTPCPGEKRPFRPRLVAGTTNPVAGSFSNFHLKLDRDDGDQFLGDLNFRMPPGFTGDLSGIPYCSEEGIAAAAAKLGTQENAAPSCPVASQVGTTNVAAGPGSHPFHSFGRLYLAGPLKGAPLSLVAVTPALAGPYDYGVVVVRVALQVDPQTAQVSAVSDRVPQIIGGVPIRMRSIQVNIDRPDFTLNPTNCSNFAVDSQGVGDQGTVADFSSPFTAVNCSKLGFRPRMSVRELAKGKTRRSQNPTLRFLLRTRAGDANIRSLAVTLPNAFEIDQRHLGNICSEKELSTRDCAGRTPIGQATTNTPLLDQPLSGPVFAVSGSGGLPRLAFILDGQVNLLPRADTRTVGRHNRLRTTVPVVPDAPIGRFDLTIFGGKRGYLINTRDICRQAPVIAVDYVAQNGKKRSQKVPVRAPCGSPR